MTIASHVLTALVAVLHLYFLVLEMFLWTGPVGQNTFRRTAAQQQETKVLAANQGLYNGFLAAGLIWGLVAGRRDVKVFFLACVIAAGVYGGLTAKTTILYTQGAPALLALLAVLAARPARVRPHL